MHARSLGNSIFDESIVLDDKAAYVSIISTNDKKIHLLLEVFRDGQHRVYIYSKSDLMLMRLEENVVLGKIMPTRSSSQGWMLAISNLPVRMQDMLEKAYVHSNLISFDQYHAMKDSLSFHDVKLPLEHFGLDQVVTKCEPPSLPDRYADLRGYFNACKNGNESLVKTYLSQGMVGVDNTLSEVSSPFALFKAFDCKTALMHAAEHGKIHIAKLLIQFNADVNRENSLAQRGRTALVYAAESGRFGVADLLIRHGAHINRQKSIVHLNALPAAYHAKQYFMFLYLYMRSTLRNSHISNCALIADTGQSQISSRIRAIESTLKNLSSSFVDAEKSLTELNKIESRINQILEENINSPNDIHNDDLLSLLNLLTHVCQIKIQFGAELENVSIANDWSYRYCERFKNIANFNQLDPFAFNFALLLGALGLGGIVVASSSAIACSKS